MSHVVNVTDIPLERVRACWVRASSFPGDKEAVYPEHAAAHGFDAYEPTDVLEYGCGGGSDTLSLLRRKHRVWYADITPANVTATQERVIAAGHSKSATGLVLQESADIPVIDGRFGLVTCHGVLHHIPEPMPVLREFFRVLRPGGHLYVMLYTEQLWARLLGQTMALVGRGLTREEAFGWGTDGEGCPYAVHYTHASGRKLLTDAGFQVEPEAALYNREDFRTFHAIRP